MAFCNRVTYLCLIRPSYVLSGAAMKVVFNDEDLEHPRRTTADGANSQQKEIRA